MLETLYWKHEVGGHVSTYLNHLILTPLTRRPHADVVARHADEPLDAVAIVEGDPIEDEVADAEGPAAVAGVGHVGGDPVPVDGEGGHHGGPQGGGELEAVGLDEVHGAEEFYGGEGDAEGVGEEVGEDHDGRFG